MRPDNGRRLLQPSSRAPHVRGRFLWRSIKSIEICRLNSPHVAVSRATPRHSAVCLSCRSALGHDMENARRWYRRAILWFYDPEETAKSLFALRNNTNRPGFFLPPPFHTGPGNVFYAFVRLRQSICFMQISFCLLLETRILPETTRDFIDSRLAFYWDILFMFIARLSLISIMLAQCNLHW